MGNGHWLFVTTEILSSCFFGDDFQEGRVVMDIQHREKMNIGDIEETLFVFVLKW